MTEIAGNRLSCSSSDEKIISVAGGGGAGAGAGRASCCKNFNRDEFCFQAKVEVEEGHDGAYSPTFWKNNNNDSCESSPLLPCDHHYSNLSRRQAILEARKELMEMIRDMPESSYELSLKDIVDHDRQKKKEDVYDDDHDGDGDDDDERSFHFETEAQIKKKKKNQQQQQKKKKMKRMESSGSNKFSRSASMDSEIFLIKMFSMPSCFGSNNNNKKKVIATHGNGSSKVSPRNSFEIHEDDDHHKKPRIIRRIFSAGENNNRGKFLSSGIRSNSDSVSTSRLAGKYFSPGCWPFLQMKKSKARKQSGF